MFRRTSVLHAVGIVILEIKMIDSEANRHYKKEMINTKTVSK
jgi:hypothetical protein